MIQLLDVIALQILILGLKMITSGQNKISRALIWCKVRLCRPNITRDMIKKKKQGFSFMLQKCKIWHFLKITVLTFFIISPVIFGLQRCTLPQIKALEILFWPWFIIFSPRINICWAIMSRSCQRFFDSPFMYTLVNLPWFWLYQCHSHWWWWAHQGCWIVNWS